MAYNPLHKLRDNIKAIKLALSETVPTPDEAEILKKYSGFGGIKAILYDPALPEEWPKADLRLLDDIKELHAILREKFDEQEYKSIVASIRESVLSAFYTPPVIPQTLYKALSEQGIDIKSVYEPSAGAGVFVTEASAAEEITAVEKDKLTAKILSAICQDTHVEVYSNGFEEMPRDDDGRYDLIASNIPFGNFKIEGERVHNYFFSRGIDKLKDGGLLAYITTDGFLNSPQNKEQRENLFKRTDFISVAVLPDNLMKETGGTEAPTHLLVVQRNNRKTDYSNDEKLLIDTVNQSNEFGDFTLNSYLADHPELFCGDGIKPGTNQYGHAHISVWQHGDINEIAARLAAILRDGFNQHYQRRQELTFLPMPAPGEGMQLDMFADRALSYISRVDQEYVKGQTAQIVSSFRAREKPEHESVLVLTAQSKLNPFYVYRLYSNLKEIEVPPRWMNANALDQELDRVRTALSHFPYEFIYGDPAKPEIPKSAMMLQYEKVRDSYLELFDREATTSIAQPFLRDQLNGSYKQFVSAYGMLNKAGNRNEILNDEKGFVVLSSLERKEGDGYVKADIFYHPVFKADVPFTSEDPAEALAHCLNEKGFVDLPYISSITGSTDEDTIAALRQYIFMNPLTRHWETADLFLSGNVVAKLRKCESGVVDDETRRSIGALQQVQPEKIPFELLDFNLGERWIPLDYYQRFVTELFEVKTTISYLSSIDSFKVVPQHHNAKINAEFSITPKSGKIMYGQTLVEHALENTAPFFTYEVDDRRIPDNEATQLAHQKIESVRRQFVEWLGNLPIEDKSAIEKLYNDTFNCYVLREYNGDHLQFPGLNRTALDIEDLYTSQKNAAWRIIQNRGALIDHEVGLGKTLTMVVSAHEMKRLGIIHKPMILALKANVSQIADTYRRAYPGSKILYPGENDFSPQRRQQLFHAIKNNNWDCIILTHDQFGKIPQSPDIQRQIFEAELDHVERDLQTLKDMGTHISKQMLKGLEIRKKNLQSNLKVVLHKIESKKDTDINFGELGVDHLFIDEAHKFKNLTFTTRHNRVAGLGNTEGSQKALNMLFAVRTLQDKFNADICVTFLSGTPISNSLTEMYLLFKYLRPKELERQRIENFDAWAAVFAKKSTDFEFSVTNEIIAKERFRHFIKVPELALFYNEITDYKTARHIQLDKPALIEELINIKPSEDQVAFTKKLMAFAKSGDGSLIGRPRLSDAEDKGRMLIATNYAKKMAADMRLIDPHLYDDHPNSKVSVCANRLAAIYRETSGHRGTQIVFCDTGTPKPDAFNLYDALKEKLIHEYNLPAHEITYIHDWTDAQKPELFRKMNAGHIRIMIGSTDKAGTGLNVQQRVVAMHHLDIPWKPSELEQRNGRGARQGNVIAKQFFNNEVKSYIYAVEQSLDNYKFNLLKNKQTFISQMKNCELNVRSIDEGALDEKSGMNFSEYIAILSGDTTLLEKSKLEKKVAVLESLRSVHHKEIVRSRYKLESLLSDRTSVSKTLHELSRDEFSYLSQLKIDKDGAKINALQLNGAKHSDAELTGKFIIDLYKNWKGNEECIGTIYGFNCYIRQQQDSFYHDGIASYRYYNAFYVQHKDGGPKYTYNQGHPSAENPKLAARHFLSALDRVIKVKEQYEDRLKELDTNIPVLKHLTEKGFEKEQELKVMKLELSRLEREITLKLQGANIKKLTLTKKKDKNIIPKRKGRGI